MEDFGIWDEHGAVKDHVLDYSLRSQAVVDKHGKLRHLKAARKKPKLISYEHRHKKSEEKKSREKEKEKKKSQDGQAESRKRKRSNDESNEKIKKMVATNTENHFGDPAYVQPPFDIVQRPMNPLEPIPALICDQMPDQMQVNVAEGAIVADNANHNINGNNPL